MYRKWIILYTLILMCSGCGVVTRYVPDQDQYVVKAPRWPLNRAPTEHEKRTYQIYKDDHKKLTRWYRELKEREIEIQD